MQRGASISGLALNPSIIAVVEDGRRPAGGRRWFGGGVRVRAGPAPGPLIVLTLAGGGP